MASPIHGVYGRPDDDLVAVPPDALQVSPLVPGAAALEAQAANSLDALAIVAPPGTAERRTVLALGLRALAPGAPFTALARKDRGGARLVDELGAFGCSVREEARRHHRICTGVRPDELHGIDEAIVAGGPRRVESMGLVSQPGLFSWDRVDPGSALLVPYCGALAGRGADFGCGIGVLSLAALASPKVAELTLIDVDRRAIEAASKNVRDDRAILRWADLHDATAAPTRLDFIVMNPPFHDAGVEDRGLGQTFIRNAAAALRTGGRLYLTANRHLPYEAVLAKLFRKVTPLAVAAGYKVFEAQK